MNDISLITYPQVLEQIKDEQTVHLLIGNGFSVDCDKIFSYPSIYQKAVENGLSKRAQGLFEKLGTNNFEGVMHLLDNAHWVAHHYGLLDKSCSELLKDNELIKQTLVQILCMSHPPSQSDIADNKKEFAQKFFNRYTHIFCTNYDLLPYWVNMYNDEKKFQDGFREDHNEPDAEYLVFSERGKNNRTLYYIHGALHIYVAQNGETHKLSYARTQQPLMNLINQGLENHEYPLFVAEGNSEKKLLQIHQNAYLNYCFEKLGRVKGTLVIFGNSLGNSDTHIRNVIAENMDFNKIYISMYGDPNLQVNQNLLRSSESIKARRIHLAKKSKHPLEIYFFDSVSANVWGNQPDDLV